MVVKVRIGPQSIDRNGSINTNGSAQRCIINTTFKPLRRPLWNVSPFDRLTKKTLQGLPSENFALTIDFLIMILVWVLLYSANWILDNMQFKNNSQIMHSYEEIVFQLISNLPGPFWLALIFLSHKKWAMNAYDVFLILLSAHFAWLTFPMIPELLPIIAKPEFETIRSKLSTPTGFLGSWNHMVLGDLWIGRWVVFDAKNLKVNAWIRLPFVFCILFFGPLGLFCYFVFRIIKTKKIYFFS